MLLQSNTARPTLRTRFALGLLILAAVVLYGCRVLILSGTAIVVSGDTAIYELEIANINGNPGSNQLVYLYMDVPLGWTLLASSYVGTTDGQEVSGEGLVTTDPGVCSHPSPSAGLQRIILVAGPFALIDESATSIVTVDFLAGGNAGDYELTFRTSSDSGCASEASDSMIVTVLAVECTDVPLNLFRLANCGFNSGIAGWSVEFGENAVHNSGEGIPSPGSYQIDSLDDDEGDRATTILSPCVPIAPSRTYQVSGQFKLTDPLDAVECEFFVAGYSDDDCASFDTGMESVTTTVTGSDWTSVLETYVSQPVTSSMNMFVTCYEDAAGPDFTMLMDNFIADASAIFADGFENGDTSAWSNTQP